MFTRYIWYKNLSSSLMMNNMHKANGQVNIGRLDWEYLIFFVHLGTSGLASALRTDDFWFLWTDSYVGRQWDSTSMVQFLANHVLLAPYMGCPRKLWYDGGPNSAVYTSHSAGLFVCAYYWSLFFYFGALLSFCFHGQRSSTTTTTAGRELYMIDHKYKAKIYI